MVLVCSLVGASERHHHRKSHCRSYSRSESSYNRSCQFSRSRTRCVCVCVLFKWSHSSKCFINVALPGQFVLCIVNQVAHQCSDHLCNMSENLVLNTGDCSVTVYWSLKQFCSLGINCTCSWPDITVLCVSMLNVWLSEYCGLQYRKEKTDLREQACKWRSRYTLY